MYIVIIAGFSASGKSTILDTLCKRYNYEKIITSTTRTARPGESNGIDYHFLSKENFSARIENNLFLEHVESKGNFYGCELSSFDKDFKEKTPAIILDPEGAKEATRILSERGHTPITIFINETPKTCISRVLSREANSEEKEKRINDIKTVESNWDDYMDYTYMTKPLSTIKDNCVSISEFVENQKKEKKIKRKTKRKP